MTQMSRKLGYSLRSARRIVSEGPLGVAANRLRAQMSSEPVLSCLIISDGEAYTSEEQFAPLKRHASQIARRFGLVFRFVGLEEARQLSDDALQSFAVVGLKLSFRMDPAEAAATAAQFFDPLKDSGTRALVFDGDDDPGVLWHEVIARSDAYIKKHIHADPETYRKVTVGKSNLTDYVHRNFGTSFADFDIPTSGGLDDAAIAKVQLGWNIALDDKIYELSGTLKRPQAGSRCFDLSCRASVPETVWTHPMRNAAVDAIKALDGRFNVHAPTDRVPQDEYYNEMLSSRMSVSPYGYGELCWRDFESILCGAVLVKPDMSHIRTAPDLFVPGETYVPVKWDFSNLGEACAPYLEDEDKRLAIAQRAYDRLIEALEPEWFIERFGKVMQDVGVLAPRDF